MLAPSRGIHLNAASTPTPDHFVIGVSLRLGSYSIDTFALVDCGATRNFMNDLWAREHEICRLRKAKPEPVFAINNTVINGGTYQTNALVLDIGNTSTRLSFELANVSHYPIILGLPWLRQTNPHVDWVNNWLKFPNSPIIIQGVSIGLVPDNDTCFANTAVPVLNDVPKDYIQFHELFQRDKADVLPRHGAWDHEMPLEEGKQPPFGPVFPMSPTELNTLKEYLDEMLAKGFIRRSHSPAGSPVIFVKKKDGTLRLCVDYRGLNAITIKNRTPLPLIDETLDRIRDAKIYTKLDLRGAYNLVRIKQGEEWKTAFRTRYGLFEYLVMPFGLTNAPATFQSMINDVLRPYLDVFVVVYLDDILIFSDNQEQHVQHVTTVLEALSQHDLYVKAEKCDFHVTSTEFLGYNISPSGITMAKDKVQAIKDWPTPKSKHDVQVFLGFCNFYRRFIENFSKLAKPLYLLTGNVSFNWSEQANDSFTSLKSKFQEAPLLCHFSPDKPTFVETDASNYALGAILSQTQSNGKTHPVAFFARSLSSAEQNYEIYDKEMLGIVEALKHWRTYLEESPKLTTIHTDHKNLEYFTTTKVLNQRQARWSELLSRYNFVIKYKQGHNNKADALSRRPDLKPEGGIEASPPLIAPHQYIRATATTSSGSLIGQIRNAYLADPTSNLAVPRGIQLDVKEGLVFMGHQVYVPPVPALKLQILQDKHDSPLSGHQGLAKTFELISREFYWPELRKDTLKYVQSCDVCQRTKTPRHLPYGLLQPLEIADTPWASISMDFIVKLPLSQNFDSILVVVDRLTKMSHFIPCREAMAARELAELVFANVFKLHGLPRDIVTDRGPTFRAQFTQQVLKLLQTKSKMSTSFHPQTDGQTERVNQTLEQYLRCYVSSQQDDWSQWLPMAEFQYNNTQSSTTSMSPFYANYGFHPRMSFDEIPASAVHNPAGADLVERIRRVQDGLRAELEYAIACYKEAADAKRLESPVYAVGDLVFLSTRNLTLQRPSKKLSWKYIGPFPIQRVIRNHAAYELKLPTTMKIHSVFHPSLLKPANVNTELHPMPSDPPGSRGVELDDAERFEVKAILQSRRFRRGLQYLVEWQGYSLDEATWEPAH